MLMEANVMLGNYSGEGASYSSGQQIPWLMWNWRHINTFIKSLHLDPILNCLNKVFIDHINSILLSVPKAPK